MSGLALCMLPSFASLFDLIKELSLTISDKKLVPPSTKVVCLGVLINTEDGTVSIPPDKLRQINDTVNEWLCNIFELYASSPQIWPCRAKN